MKTYRCSLRLVKLVFLVCQFGLILRTEAQTPGVCIEQETYKPPSERDVKVTCGPEYMELSILLCPVYQANYNEDLMVLNEQFDKPDCYGVADWNVDPPVLKFSIPIDEGSISFCKNRIMDQVVWGVLSNSTVQLVNISGTITSVDLWNGMFTFRPWIRYNLSCMYTMQHLLDNTKLKVSGVNPVIRDDNGTFTSKLSLLLYKDELYREMLFIPQSGLNQKTRIYVVVKATNLTDRFNVFLDRCYATASPNPKTSTYYNLFEGCRLTPDAKIKMELNGASQEARFSFKAFRLAAHKYRAISRFYLHCVTRVCEVSSCGKLMAPCGSFVHPWKRKTHYVSDNATVTSPVIRVGNDATVWLNTTYMPPYHENEIEYEYIYDSRPLSVFDGSSTSSLNSYSIYVLAINVCSFIITVCVFV